MNFQNDQPNASDELLADFVLRRYRHENGVPPRGRDMQPSHLATCPSTCVVDLDARNGTYGCDTGCEYYRLEATLHCDHEETDFEFGDFGELADLIEDLKVYADNLQGYVEEYET